MSVTAVAATASAPPPGPEVAACPPRDETEPPVRLGAEEMVALCRDLYVETAKSKTFGDPSIGLPATSKTSGG